MSTFNSFDWIVVGTYFFVVFCVGMWATFRPNKGTNEGYFLAGKSMHWIPVGASIFATNVGAPMFIGLAGDAAASGLAVTLFEWQAAFMLIALGWIFLPVYTASGTFTMPEFLEKRYGHQRLRILYSLVSVALLAFRNIPGEMFAGALFLNKILRWEDPIFAVLLILGTTAVYTIAGGLAAVIYTDTLQSVILIIGTIVLTVISVIKVGGIEAIYEKYPNAISNHSSVLQCGLPKEHWSHFFHSYDDPDWPWPGLTFGLTIVAGIWYMDQVYVQRVLSAKNITHAKAGCVLAAFLKILPFVLFIVPGVISRILHPDIVGCATAEECKAACGIEASCSNMAFPQLVLYELPPGLRGIMFAALMAALVSSLTSIFNSASTMFTVDIWAKIRPKATQLEQGVVGRVFVLVLVAVSVAWLPVMSGDTGAKLWNYFQLIASCITPPWIVAFLFGVFWSRATEKGAFVSLLAGEVLGFAWVILSFTSPTAKCGSNAEPNFLIKHIHFMHFAIILFLFTAVIMVVVSLVTKPEDRNKLRRRRVTFWDRHFTFKELDEADDMISDQSTSFFENQTTYDANNVDQFQENIEDKVVFKEPGGSKGLLGKIKSTMLEWLCGISNKVEPVIELSESEKKAREAEATSIKENPFYKSLLDVAAIVCITIILILCVIFR